MRNNYGIEITFKFLKKGRDSFNTVGYPVYGPPIYVGVYCNLATIVIKLLCS